MNNDYISREAAIENFTQYTWYDEWGSPISDSDEQRKILREMFADIPAADVRPVPPGGIGEMSDGYHTFNGLYYQRMVLFAALVKQNKDSAWKSHRHEDGELCFGGGWFIVGIDTPEGSYTYHYEDKDWDLFDCEELPAGKHWDGHTEDDVTRLLSLPEVRPVVRGEWIETGYFDQDYQPIYECSHCHREVADNFMAKHWFCLHCGADMRTIGQRLSDISAEEDLFPELTAEEKAANKAEAKRMSAYPCADCRWSPPSSFGGKPCSHCDTNDPLMNCYQRREDT